MSKKQTYHLLFLIFVFVITCYTVFHGKDLSDMLYWMRHVKTSYLLFGMLTVPVFVCCESMIMLYLMGRLGKRIPFISCAKYSFIGFFFSCITPSATGGQPAQVVTMHQDGIDTTLSSLVLLLITIGYKLVLVMVGLGCLLLARPWLYQVLGGAIVFFYLGMILNTAGIVGLLFLVFSPTLASSLTCYCVCFFQRIHLLPEKPDRLEKIRLNMADYHHAARWIKDNKQVLIPVIAISFIQRMILFLVTYLVYLSFDLTGGNMLTILILQALISLSVDMLPLPGGMGASENLFLLLFSQIFGSQLILPAMLLSRGISFYILLLLSAGVTVCATLHTNKKWRFET